jgi:hypothetical protein
MMKPNLKVPCHLSSLFMWRDGNGAAEASDLPRPMCARVWADAADVGFEVVSTRTGVKKLFLLTSEDFNANGDLERWVFTSHGPGVRVVLSVYND